MLLVTCYGTHRVHNLNAAPTLLPELRVYRKSQQTDLAAACAKNKGSSVL